MDNNGQTAKIDISTGTIFRAVLILISFWFLYVIFDFLLMLFASVVVASAIRPVADRLERYRVPRALSVVLVYIVVLVLLSVVVSLIVPPLAEQVTQLAHALPALVEYLSNQGLVPSSGAVKGTVSAWQQALAGVGNNLANVGAGLFRQTRTVFSGVFTLVFMFVIALYLVVDKDVIKKPFQIVVPARHMPYVEMAINRAQKKIGRWMLAQLTLGVIIGVVVSVGLWLMGVPYSLLLGLVAGVLEMVPIIGPIVAAVPAVLVGFTQSWMLGLGIILFYLLVQQAENHLLIPFIMRKATGLNPLVIILAILLGARLVGVVGVLLAVPAAVVICAFVNDLASASETNDELAG
ncbi:MAG: AI-2E family transporter [bacterium]